jgi:histidine ammonia-lyase
MRELELSGKGLSLAEAAAVLSGEVVRLRLAGSCREAVERSCQCLDHLLSAGQVIYGVNTGFGKLAQQRIEADEMLQLQENLIRSHAVGMGLPLSPGISRLALALRIQSLVQGYSGVTWGLIERLVELFNRGVIPVLPEQGSVGASGDLAPLAHLALLLLGEGEAWLLAAGQSLHELARQKPVPGRQALHLAGLEPYQLRPKEGLALINGTQVSCALLAEAAVQAEQVAALADVALSLTLEATRSSLRPFDARLAQVRPHPGAAVCASNVRLLLQESDILPSHAHCSKVQDAYSLRCSPQVHGTFRDAVGFARQVVEREMNSVTDNPLIFADTREVISGGNFHGQPLSLAADLLCAAAATLSSISERRVENLVNPDLSGLPGFLARRPGLESGMMLVQVLAAALTSENKALAHPAGVDSIPTSGNREDHVSMSMHAARKACQVLVNTRRVLACEFLCAAQGLEYLLPLRPGRGALAAYEFLRSRVPPLECDRTLYADLAAVEEVLADGSLLRAVRRVCPELD